MFVWATYQRCAVRGFSGNLSFLSKVLVNVAVGGPIFPALMFIWERDEIVLDTLESGFERQASAKTSRARENVAVEGKI